MVETATPADYPAIAEVNLRAYFEYSSKLPPGSWEIMLPNLVNVVERAQKSQFYVVREDTRLVASAAYCPAGSGDSTVFRDNEASVLLLAVEPGARGRGLAKALVSSCVERARLDGAASIGLFTNELMQAAQQVYRLAGFRQEAELPTRHGIRFFRFALSLPPIAADLPSLANG